MGEPSCAAERVAAVAAESYVAVPDDRKDVIVEIIGAGGDLANAAVVALGDIYVPGRVHGHAVRLDESRQYRQAVVAGVADAAAA